MVAGRETVQTEDMHLWGLEYDVFVLPAKQVRCCGTFERWVGFFGCEGRFISLISLALYVGLCLLFCVTGSGIAFLLSLNLFQPKCLGA